MSVLTDVYKALAAVCQTFPSVAPQGSAAPWIVYQTVVGVDEISFADGAGAERVRVQVTCWAASAGDADRLRIAARAAIYGAIKVSEMTRNPADFELDTKLYSEGFDVTAFE